MPRRPVIAHPALRALAQEERFVPKEAARRIVERAERLASEIEPEAIYPRDYIVYRVTGYRPSDPGIELIPGDELLADLSALAETVASHAKLSVQDAPEGSLTLDDLLQRWGVSRRTVERDRRRGLVARRVRDHGGAERLLFTPDIVASFERAHPERTADRQERTTRLTDDERALMIRRSERYASSLALSRHAIAQRLAPRMGRSISTVRRVLDEQETRAGALTARLRALILRRWERADSLDGLARRLGRTRGSVHRVIMEERLRRLMGVPDPGEPDDPDGETDALESPIAHHALRVPAPQDAQALVALSDAMRLTTEPDERALALAHRVAWRRAYTLSRALPRFAPPAQLVDRIETDLRWAGLLRERLAWVALPLVVRTIEERAGSAYAELPDALRETLTRHAMSAVCEAVSGFDASRSGRLSGRASLPVDRAVIGELERERDRRSQGVARRRIRLEASAWRRSAQFLAGALEIPGWLARGLDRLDEADRALLAARYGLDGSRPLSAVEAGGAMGIGVRAVWVAHARAVRRVRSS